jgi:hypothetical protein
MPDVGGPLQADVPASSLNWSSYFSIASCIWSWLSHSEIVETRLGSFSSS